MMTQDEYMDWWITLPDDVDTVGEPVRTLIEHIGALMGRIDALPEHEVSCPNMDHRCCCSYDHPADVCVPHADAGTAEEGSDR